MSNSVSVRLCSNEYKIGSEDTQPKSKCSQRLSMNEDIILVVVAAILATFSALVAYGHIPSFGSVQPQFLAGALATFASVAFVVGILKALGNRGCVIVRPPQSRIVT